MVIVECRWVLKMNVVFMGGKAHNILIVVGASKIEGVNKIAVDGTKIKAEGLTTKDVVDIIKVGKVSIYHSIKIKLELTEK